jgi:hypothetical protein
VKERRSNEDREGEERERESEEGGRELTIP